MHTEYKGADGETIVIAYMSDTHLKNAIKFFRSKQDNLFETYKFYVFGPQPMGEQAQIEKDREEEEIGEAMMNLETLIGSLCIEQGMRSRRDIQLIP